MARHSTGPRLGTSAAGYYEVRWTEEGGRSRRETTGTKDLSAAQRFLASFIFKMGTVTKATPSVDLVLATYLDDKESPTDSRESIAAKHLRLHLGELPIDAIGADTVKTYRRARWKAKRPAGKATVRRELAVLIAAINHALKQKRITAPMVPVIDLPAEAPPRTETFEPGQVEILLAMTAPKDGERMSRLHRFIWLAYETASRRRAIETLPWAKVNLDTGFVDYRIAGKHKKKRRVMVPISDRLRPMLWRMMAEKQDDLVLDTEDSLYPAWVALMKRAAKWTGDQSFIGKRTHDLRRTWATQAAARGVSLWDIAGVLGDSLATTTAHYAHHLPHHLRPAVNYRDQ